MESLGRGMTWAEVEGEFRALCAAENRQGALSAVPLARLHLLPEQRGYLDGKLPRLGVPEESITAVSLGLAYHRREIWAVPDEWTGKKPAGNRWNEYAAAYHKVNHTLNRIAAALAERFGGFAEGATLDGLAGTVSHVSQYFPLCVSHRAVAEAAKLGWRGKHGLIVTPEFGPALRLASVFLPAAVEAPRRFLTGCGPCEACLKVCPVLRKGAAHEDLNVYREMCRRRIKALGLEADVCGICVRRCHQIIVP